MTSARTLFGVEVGDLAGLALSNLFDGETVGSVESHLAAARAGAPAARATCAPCAGGIRCR